jgi:hypothetical protein
MKKEYLGYALTESLLLILISMIALVAPLPITGESAFSMLVNALKSYQAHAAYLLAMP